MDLSGKVDFTRFAGLYDIEHLIAPLGLSFYALQSISYLIDVYKSRIKPEKDFIDFLLYLAFFLKFLAGPIERVNNFIPQLNKDLKDE